MYRFIAIDLDGTLLNSYGEISAKNQSAIQYAIEKKVEVVLTSGRPISSVQTFAHEIGADHYIICGNGSIVYNMEKKQNLYTNFLNKKKVLEIIKICEENSIYYNVYTDNFILAKSLNYNVLFFNQENNKKADERKTNIKIVENLYQYIQEAENQNYLKITICDNDEIIFSSIIRKLRQLREIDVLDIEHMSRKMIKSGTEEIPIEYFYTEITNQNVNKWFAIQALIEHLHIEPEEVMAIGDNVNDLMMIKNAGLGIIMENAAPYIKEEADVIVVDNNHDGVAEAIQEYI